MVDRAKAQYAHVETLRLRVTHATERHCDNLIGKDEYDVLCARAQADMKAAMAERDNLPIANPEPELPPLDVALASAGWPGPDPVARKHESEQDAGATSGGKGRAHACGR